MCALACALAIAAVALATAACERAEPVVSPTGMWQRFTAAEYGFAFDIQEPYGPEVEGVRKGVWRAGVARTGDAGAPELTITAERVTGGSGGLTPVRLLDAAPRLTSAALEKRRAAGATDLQLEQPLQPLDIVRTPALEMIYTWTDGRSGLAMRSDVVLLINRPWLLTFEITGPALTWDQGGPTLRRFIEMLRLTEPAKQ